MKVNPVYKVQSWPRDNFPKSDLYCIQLRADDQKDHDWCTLDMHPYANSMHDAARSASRGDRLVHNATSRDSAGNIIGWKKGAPQLPGKRAVLAVTDVATAIRYGLPTAKLGNPAGTFVAPTPASLLAGVATMKPGAVPTVLEPDPQATAVDAYPLTAVTYAATAPSAITAQAGRDYAALLRYAAGPGQQPGVQPGTLPFGYAPLPANLRSQTLAAANEIVAGAGKPIATPAPTASSTDTAAGPVAPEPAPQPAAPSATPAPGVAPSAAPAAGGRPLVAPGTVPVAKAQRTPGQPVGLLRYALMAILILGGLAAGTGPVLLRLARTGPGLAPTGGLAEEVTPTP
jgi:hypothetical protein